MAFGMPFVDLAVDTVRAVGLAGEAGNVNSPYLMFFPDNAWGDAYTIVQVQISEHQDVATINAY